MLRLEAVLQGGPDALLSGTALFLQATGERYEAAERSLELGPVTLAELAQRSRFARPSASRSTRRRARRSRRDAGRAALADARQGPPLRPQRDRDAQGPDRGLPRRGPSPQPDLHPPAARGRGRSLRLPARAGGAGGGGVARQPARQHLSRCCSARRTGRFSERRSCCRTTRARPGEPRQPLRQHGDRGGAAAPRPRPLRRRARADRRAGSGRPGDDRAGRVDHRRGDHGPSRSPHLHRAGAEEQRRESNGRPPSPPPGLDEIQGESEIAAAGTTVRLGDKIVLRPGTEGDVYDKILHGRTATVERIYRGYDERVYLGVTVDDDPGQDLLRETGRFLFFFADEVEPVSR